MDLKKNAQRKRHYEKLMRDPARREARRAQHAARMREYYRSSEKHRARVAAGRDKWRANNTEWANLQNRLRRYRITLDQYHAMFEGQDFICAICGCEKTLVIDHCHGTRRFRGLLCHNCNSGIGKLRESPELFASALAYLGH
jgi:hypothetical protein